MSPAKRAPRSRPASRRSPSPAGRGLRLGPLRITPLRATLGVALAGGLAFLAWSVLVRDANQVLTMATGLAVCGIVLGAVAVLSIGRIVGAGRDGRDGMAVLTALAGGLFAMASLLLLAGAVILSLIWSGTRPA